MIEIAILKSLKRKELITLNEYEKCLKILYRDLEEKRKKKNKGEN